MKKRSNHYTFMFFPEGKGNTFTLRIHRYTLYLTVVSILLIIAGLSTLLYKTGEIGLKLQLVHGLKEENARLRDHNRDLQLSSEKIANIDSLAAYLQRLSDISNAKGSAPMPVEMAKRGAYEQPVTKVEMLETESAGPLRSVSAGGETFAASIPNIMPVNGWITKHFAVDTASDPHRGIDIAAAFGTPIVATAMGTVEDIRKDKYFGLMVELRHENGFVTRYGHCSQVLVSMGDRINRGQTVALVGNTGRSTAPHLHYEVMKYGRYADPMGYVGINNNYLAEK
jgi:murein DD-endopeptidase MepM/ murein hydrolase activator NlpD